MATLAEINTLINESTISDKVRSACIIAAVAIAYEDAQTANHSNRLKWASKALADPNGTATEVARYVIAAKATETLANIIALSDLEIQNNVNASVNIFADGS